VCEWQEFEMKSVPDPTGRKDKKTGEPVMVQTPDPTRPVMKNIVWKTPLPNMSESSPICVSKKVFTICEAGWPQDADCPRLVCVEGDTGAALWQGDVDQFDALPEPQRAEAKGLRKQYWECQRKVYGLLVQVQAAWGRDKAAAERLATFPKMAPSPMRSGAQKVFTL
jgi:hypothetical protein